MFVPLPGQKSVHRHLDGDRSMVNVMPEFFRLTHGNTKPYPFNQWSKHEELVAAWFLEGGLHKNLVDKFKVTTGVMQNPVTIFKAAENFVLVNGRRGLSGEFIMAPQYLVFGDRFCPKGTLTEKRVVEILIEGVKEGERKLREERVIATFRMLFGIGREVGPEEAERLVRIMLECDPDYVPGMSLVCHEPSAPPEKFIKAFRLAKSEGRKTACHVEWVKDREESEKDTPEKILKNFQEDLPQLTKNLSTAIFELEVDRIEHGLGLSENPELMKAVVDKGISVTVCPGSLLATRLIDSIEMLKIREQLNAGILVSLDVDDDICMPVIGQVNQMYMDAYSKPATTENMERLKIDMAKLVENSNLGQFRKEKAIPPDIEFIYW